jgi:hypothetical protein
MGGTAHDFGHHLAQAAPAGDPFLILVADRARQARR